MRVLIEELTGLYVRVWYPPRRPDGKGRVRFTTKLEHAWSFSTATDAHIALNRLLMTRAVKHEDLKVVRIDGK